MKKLTRNKKELQFKIIKKMTKSIVTILLIRGNFCVYDKEFQPKKYLL